MKICWAQYLLLLVIASLALGSLLPACGQKGPLYLPEPAAQQEQHKDQKPEQDNVQSPALDKNK